MAKLNGLQVFIVADLQRHLKIATLTILTTPRSIMMQTVTLYLMMMYGIIKGPTPGRDLFPGFYTACRLSDV